MSEKKYSVPSIPPRPGSRKFVGPYVVICTVSEEVRSKLSEKGYVVGHEHTATFSGSMPECEQHVVRAKVLALEEQIEAEWVVVREDQVEIAPA